MTQADLAGERKRGVHQHRRDRASQAVARAAEILGSRLGVASAPSGDHSAEWVIEMARDLRSEGRSRAARDPWRDRSRTWNVGRASACRVVVMLESSPAPRRNTTSRTHDITSRQSRGVRVA